MPSSGGGDQHSWHGGDGDLPAGLPFAAAPPFPGLPPRPVVLPARPLLSVALLQVVLGCSLVALNFGAMSLSRSPPVENARPLWAGCSVILSGIFGLMTWRRQTSTLANMFVLLSIVCFLLNLAGFILGCQGIQFVSSVPKCDLVVVGETKICFCCGDWGLTKCTEEEAVLKLYHLKSCSAAQVLLEKFLFALCALNGLTTTVCLVASALHCLQNYATTMSCITELLGWVCCWMLGFDVIPLPCIYRVQIRDAEVFYPLDPPPPYETLWSRNSSEREEPLQRSVVAAADSGEVSGRQVSQASTDLLYSDCFSFTFTIPNYPGEEIPESSSRVSLSPSKASPVLAEAACRRAFNPLRKRSKSDPELHSWLLQGAELSCETATKTEVEPQLCAATVQKHSRARALRGRCRSLTDYKLYTDAEWLAVGTGEQPSCSMGPDVRELVENNKSVLKSDEKRVAEATTSATFLDEVMTPAQQAMSLGAHVLPPRRSWIAALADLSTFTIGEDQLQRRIRRAEHKCYPLPLQNQVVEEENHAHPISANRTSSSSRRLLPCCHSLSINSPQPYWEKRLQRSLGSKSGCNI
ncbi:LOW QUALITY PROTEIN: endosomal transmembrane epsin interactor 1 [Pluvialis apricaria]